jgi:transposase
VAEVSTIGLDTAKQTFQAHGADGSGRAVFQRRITRDKLMEFFSSQLRCLVAMEACGGAHYWGRQIGKLGHTVGLVPPAYVKPFVKRQKNDAADADADRPDRRLELPLAGERTRHLSSFDRAPDVAGRLEENIAVLDAEITRRSKEDSVACGVITIPGAGHISATAIAALAPPADTFRNGRDFAAWLRITPLLPRSDTGQTNI